MAKKGFSAGNKFVGALQFDKYAKMVSMTEQFDSHKTQPAVYARMIREQLLVAVAEKNNIVISADEIKGLDDHARKNSGNKQKLDTIINTLGEESGDYHDFFIKPILVSKKLREHFAALDLNGDNRKTLETLLTGAATRDFATLAKENGAGYRSSTMTLPIEPPKPSQPQGQNFPGAQAGGAPGQASGAQQPQPPKPETFHDKLRKLKEGEVLPEIVDSGFEMMIVKLTKIISETEYEVEMIFFKKITFEEWLDSEIDAIEIAFADPNVEAEITKTYGKSGVLKTLEKRKAQGAAGKPTGAAGVPGQASTAGTKAPATKGGAAGGGNAPV